MRSLRLPVWSRNRAGLDGAKAETSAFISEGSSVAVKTRLQRLLLIIFRMRVLAMTVRLPNLDQGILHWLAIAIEHATGNRDPLSGNSRACQIHFFQARQSDGKERPHGLRCGGLEAHVIRPLAWLHGRSEQCQNDSREPARESWFPSRRAKSADCAPFRPPCN